ncbi:MAG: threonylcarbamoyl-AMP synthase [Bacteroidales bacterium]|nr:threonylcarbamoyl-AMP synthase [Bacteroidales bacterium]
MDDVLHKALSVLRSGGIILYPTDTVWGIGCDATNPAAVEKIYKLKQRSDSKSMIVLVDVSGRIPSYVADVPDIAWDLIDLADKPLTVIFQNAKNLAPNLVAQDGSIGIRVVKHDFCQRLIQRFGRPIVSTSANISGQPFPANFSQISDEIKRGVDFIVPEQFCAPISEKPSSIVAVGSGGTIKIIRD